MVSGNLKLKIQNSKCEIRDTLHEIRFTIYALSFCLFFVIPAQAETQYASFDYAQDASPPLGVLRKESIGLRSESHPSPRPSEGRDEIGSITTAGNRSVSSERILSKVRSRVGELFDPATAAEDAKRIAQLSGVEYSYYNTTILDGKIQLTFVIFERNIVRAITFVGNRKVKADVLRRKLDLRVGDYLDLMLAEAGRKTLLGFYRKKGFAFAAVELDRQKLPEGKLIFVIDEGPRVKIDLVIFSGNNTLKTKVLKNVIKSRKEKFLLWPVYYNEQTVDEDVVRLQNAYRRRGFLDSSIKVTQQFNEKKDKVRLIFVIDEGPVYTIERTVLTGNKYFDEQQLRADLKLEPGQVYSERKAASDAEQLLKLYRENGFIDARVDYSAGFVSEDRVAIEFEIMEGQRFRIGRISITGNEQTQDKVVRRILDEYDFQPGQWYNADIARGNGTGELERSIQRMVLTQRGAATITPGGELPGQRDARVSIVEGQTGMVMVGAGASSDSGIIGQLIFDERNFDISDWPDNFSEFITGRAFKGAGQSLRIALQPGTEISEYLISFSEPYFKSKPIALDVVGSSWKRFRESYDEQRTKGYFGFEKRYKNRWRRSISFRFENVDVDDIDSDAPREIVDVKGDNALMGVRFGIGRDLAGDRFNPSEGDSFNANYEQLAGDHTFGILGGTYRWYSTVYEDLAGRKTVLAARLRAATVIGDAPPFEKFYGGGTGIYGIRGFDYRGVSTRGGVDKDPIGSDWIFLAGTEVTVPLVSDTLAVLFFVDSGAIDSGPYRVAVGTGIQILLPQWFGHVPMRFEIAAPLIKDDDDDTQVFSFSVGRLF